MPHDVKIFVISFGCTWIGVLFLAEFYLWAWTRGFRECSRIYSKRFGVPEDTK